MIQYGRYEMSPSFKRIGEESQKGSHITLKIPIPVRRNIEAAKYPKAGRKMAKEPKDEKCLRLVKNPTKIKAITPTRHK
jgi:hypothetical protein